VVKRRQRRRRPLGGIVGCIFFHTGNNNTTGRKTVWLMMRILVLVALMIYLRFYQLHSKFSAQLRRVYTYHAEMIDVPAELRRVRDEKRIGQILKDERKQIAVKPLERKTFQNDQKRNHRDPSAQSVSSTPPKDDNGTTTGMSMLKKVKDMKKTPKDQLSRTFETYTLLTAATQMPTVAGVKTTNSTSVTKQTVSLNTSTEWTTIKISPPKDALSKKPLNNMDASKASARLYQTLSTRNSTSTSDKQKIMKNPTSQLKRANANVTLTAVSSSSNSTLSSMGSVNNTHIPPIRNNSIITKHRHSNVTTDLSYYLSSGDALLEDIAPGYIPHDTLKLRYPPPPCGYFKCFFPSQHDPAVGYTVGQHTRRMTVYTPKILRESYQLVQRLSKQIEEHPYHLPPMMHLYHPEYPPVILPYNTSENLYQFMKQELTLARLINNGTITMPSSSKEEEAVGLHRNTNGAHDKLTPQPKEQWSVRHRSNDIDDENEEVKEESGDIEIDGENASSSKGNNKVDNTTKHKVPFYFRTKKFFKKNFYVQALWKIPYNSFLYYFQQHKSYREKNIAVTMEWLASMDVLLAQQRKSTGENITNNHVALAEIAYWSTFDETLYRYINQTIVLLEMDPSLSFDFQVAVDPQGRIWHFDMDRGLGHDWFNKTDQVNRIKKMNMLARVRIPKDLQTWYAVVHEFVMKKKFALMPLQEQKKRTSEEHYKEWKKRLARTGQQEKQ
jgi:hypothetical protein